MSSEWQDRAACVDTPLEWWFPEREDGYAYTDARVCCAGCPVQPECKETTMEREGWNDRFGFVAGMSPKDRHLLSAQSPRRRRRGPRVPVDLTATFDTPTPARHGTRYAYQYHGCRCGPCTDAKTSYDRALRTASPVFAGDPT